MKGNKSMELCEEFKTILYTDICNDISKAFNSLTNDMYQIDDKHACKIVDEMTDEMKKVLFCYIEQQKNTFYKIRTASLLNQ